ncbi:DNA helicase [Ranunculus cassubicifolius]
MKTSPLFTMLLHASQIITYFCHKISTKHFGTSRINIFNTSTSKPHKLNYQQQLILKSVSKKQSIFITGSAGTGKSFVVSQAIDLLKQIYYPNEVFITASTGVAACALNGQTLHSFAGVGLGVGSKEGLLRKVLGNKLALKRWKKAKALVIDEVSMISCEFFENLEYIARMIRASGGSGKNWGGIQLIVSGDFFQLPPIVKDSLGKEFAFEAECWNDSFHLQVELTQIFRQSDAELIDLLQGVRRGRKEENHLQILKHCCSEPMEASATVPRLYPRNVDVQRVNEEKLRTLGGEIVKFVASDSGLDRCKKHLSQMLAADELEICKGARVMLIKNKDLDSGLVNGAMGTVVDFVVSDGNQHKDVSPKGLLPKVRFDSGLVTLISPEKWDMFEGEKVLATRKQIPLILAWAVSVHKCQGMTLDCLHTDLSRAFGYGMVYVALSRVRSLKGLHLSGFDSLKIKAHPKVLEFYDNQLVS